MPAAPTAPSTPTTPPPPVARSLAVHRPGAPPRVLLAVAVAALVAALVLPAAVPGVGVLLLAAVVAVVVSAVRAPAQRRSRWQWAHGSAAVLLAAGAAVRDAGWVVALDLAGALLLATVALAPARGWPSVLGAPLRPVARLGAAVSWLLRGLRVLTRTTAARLAARRGTGSGTGPGSGRLARAVPALRGVALTAVLLAVFVPLLAGADARFGAVFGDALDAVARALQQLAERLGLSRADLVLGRAVVFVLAAVAMGAALVVAWDARGDVAAPAERQRGDRRPVLARRVEWLLPLGVLDALFAAFLLVRTTAPADPSATYAEQVHSGFAQLVVATALVLGVVALAVRWTPMTTGPRAALAALCQLSLGLDAAALVDLHAYVDAYGLTRLRIGVVVICAGLAALLVLLLVAGALGRDAGRGRAVQRWVPHAAVLVAAVSLLGLTAADPDAAVARSQLSRAASGSPSAVGPDLDYLEGLSADAAPAVSAALTADPSLLGEGGACLLAQVAGTAHPDPAAQGWASANLSRSRAAQLVTDPSRCP